MGYYFRKHSNPRRNYGFTLIEIIVIITVLGIIAAVSIPRYADVAGESKKAACRRSLNELRSAISIYYSEKAAVTGYPVWPELDTLSEFGAVLASDIPPNPFQPNAPDSIVEGFVPGVIVGDRGGWAYKPSTGQIWPNTNTTIPGGGCSAPEDIYENLW